ncbi:MAG: V-type ATPase subunit [Deltaproteobacteria bacterium]|nr:V-type ATPase subunit [Deltaproteobacteria bacterium]MBW2594638.1 V-type ATPase subunit [Deltaproteobacteria bacterium]MBW2649512.1 V-type ATPase subunit [Deltaproteobacteria bacterium]
MNLISARYAFISAYLKGEEARGITSGHIGEIVQRSANMQDALEIIRDTDIGEYLLDQPIKTFDDADEYLWIYMDECLKRLERFKTPPDMLRMASLYVEKYDVLNIRIALRILSRRELSSMVPLGAIHNRGYLKEMSAAREREEISGILARCDLGDYGRLIMDIKEKDRQAVSEGEIRLQNIHHQKLLEAFKDMDDGDLLVKTFRIIIDLANLQTVFRLSLGGGYPATGVQVLSGGRMLPENTIRELLTLKMTEITGRLENTGYHMMAQDVSKSYERDGKITASDKITEKHKFRLLKDLLSPRVLSSSNMLWYLLLKELEIRNLRLTFKMLSDGIPAAEIQDLVIAA